MWLMTSPHVPRGTPVRALAAAPPFPALNNNAKKRQDKKEKQRELQQAARGSSSLLSWVKQPEPTSKEDEDADVPDEPLPIINDEDEEERQLQQAQGSSPLLSCNSPSMSMEDEGDKSIENISESDTDEAEMSESRAAPCSETVLSDDDQNEGEMEGESSIDEESQEPTVRQELEKTVLSLLQKNGLELKNLYGQGYDGAANMSGMYKGLQARIRAHNEKALYVHCKAHCLNLVLVEASKSNKHFITFFNIVEKLYAFCNGSPKRHAALVKCQQSLYPGQRVLELQQLSDTRWACREAALKALQRNLNAVLKLLDDIIDIDPPDLA
ncbi:Zinc finger MYM-type protein 1 [Dissostichus eleginoides]|uniref:Zinc finger MYM-type protein 1 n=1 Tax=Dissostichus eleginoides TaxID=100907 RepID=A0AAD9B9B0_DISEL|nr:Zinc finger MYM-type protein 1 [Dissostichus eleginoides]